MTTCSGRLLANLIYMHLRGRQEHAEKCTAEKCVPACGFEQFEQWLDAPATVFDRLADQRQQARLSQLLAGQVPG